MNIHHLVVEHPGFIRAKEEMRRCLESFGTCPEPRCIPILGPSGSGKSTVLREFAKEYPVVELESGVKRPVLVVQMPANPTLKALPAEVLRELGDPLYFKGTEVQMTHRIFKYLENQDVRLLMLDDVQNIIDRESDRLDYRAAEWVKLIISQKDRPLPTVICGLEQTARLFEVNAQLRRRFRKAYSMDTFGWDDSEKRRLLKGLLKSLQEALPFEDGLTIYTGDMAYRFYCATKGLVGYIMAIIREAKKLADNSLDGVIRLSHLAEAYENTVYGNELIGVNPFTHKDVGALEAALMAVDPPVKVTHKGRKGGGSAK